MMKIRFFSIALVLLVCSFSAPAQTIKLDVRGITIATTQRAVLRKLGKPLSTIRGGQYSVCDEGPMRTMKYPGLVLRLLHDDDRKEYYVAAVDITSAKWPVAPKIGIGSRFEDIIAKFGKQEVEIENGRKTVSYLMDEGFAVFTFRRGKAVKIAWEFNVC